MGGPHFRRAEFEAVCNLAEQSCQLTGNLGELTLSKELLSWSTAFLGPKSAEFLLQGIVRGTFSLRQRFGGGEAPQIAAKLALLEGRLEHPRLPRPLTDLSCEIRVENETTTIEGLRCNCGSAALALQLERRGWQLAAPLSLALRAENVLMDRVLHDALNPPLQAEWPKYQPTGILDADLQLTFDGLQWKPALTLTGRNLAFQSDKFPYRVSEGSGTISYLPGTGTQTPSMNINLVGYGGGQPLTFTGQIFDPKPGAMGWLEVVGENVEIEERMINCASREDQDRHPIHASRGPDQRPLANRSHFARPTQALFVV